MRQIRLIFRRVGKGDEWFQWLIACYTKLLPANWFTNGFYSHTEIEFISRKECFSSANKGDFNGVRFEKTENVIRDQKKWDGISIAIGLDEEIRLYNACKQLEGLPYDWLGVFGFALPIGINDKKRWYCSEVCAHVMNKAGLFPDKFKIVSPMRWAEKSSKYFKRPVTNLGRN